MKSLDEVLSRLNTCINELDDIFDDLTYLEVDATELVKLNDSIEKFYNKLADDEEYIPDLYHKMVQERLDEEHWGD